MYPFIKQIIFADSDSNDSENIDLLLGVVPTQVTTDACTSIEYYSLSQKHKLI